MNHIETRKVVNITQPIIGNVPCRFQVEMDIPFKCDEMIIRQVYLSADDDTKVYYVSLDYLSSENKFGVLAIDNASYGDCEIHHTIGRTLSGKKTLMICDTDGEPAVFAVNGVLSIAAEFIKYK